MVDGEDATPFDIWFVPPGDDGKLRQKGATRTEAAAATAAEIARLLNLASEERAQIVSPESPSPGARR
jgi:hypothetical protein